MATIRTPVIGNYLAYATLAILALAIALLGASAANSSVLISFLCLALTGFTIWRDEDAQADGIIFVMLYIFFVVLIVHWVNGVTKGNAAEYLMTLSAIFVFALGSLSVKRGGKPGKIWLSILIVGLVFSIFALFQHLFSPNHIFGMERPLHKGRLSGSFLSSNTASTFLGMIVLASIAHMYRNWRLVEAKAKRIQNQLFADFLQTTVIGIVTFLFSFSALLLTASRSGITLTLCGCLLLGFVLISQTQKSSSSKKKYPLGSGVYLIAGIVLAAIVFWAFSGSHVSNRYASIPADYQQRQNLIEASWTAFQYKPIFGHGLGNYNEAKLLGTTPLNNMHVMWETQAHNFYMQTLVQSGIVGLLSVAGLYIYIIVCLFRGMRRNRPYSTYLSAILVMSLLVSAHAVFDYALEVPAVMLFHAWVLGVGYGLQQKYR